MHSCGCHSSLLGEKSIYNQYRGQVYEEQKKKTLLFLLQHLKTRLQARFLDQALDYSCQVEGLVTQDDKEIVSALNTDNKIKA